MNRIVKAGLAGLASIALLTACSTGGGNDSGNGAGDEGDSGEALVLNGEEIADAELYAAALEEGGFTLYDNYPEGPWRELLDVFEADTGLTVEHVRLVTPQLYERAVSEAGANRLEADAIGMGDITLMNDMAQRGILESYDSPLGLEHLDPGQIDPDHYWYTSAHLVMVPTYNEHLVDAADVPENWNDLLDEQWRGKIGATPIITGGSAFSVYHLMRDKFGIEYWEDLAANDLRLYESVTPLTQDLVRGEVPMGITSLGTVSSQRAQGAPIVPVFFDEGTPAFSNLVSVTKDSANPNAARVYLNWLLSLRGQEVLVDITSEYPVREDAPAPSIEGVDLPAADSGKIVVPPFSAWVDLRDPWTEEWNAIFH